MGSKVVCSGNVILILLVLVISLLPIPTIAVGQPAVEMKFDPGEDIQYADVAPGDSGLVFFPGTVSADLAAGGTVQDVVVTLDAFTDLGWPTTVEPDTIYLDPGTTEASFLATVSVPPETSWNVSEALTVSGTAMAYPGALRYYVGTISGTIIINQYYRFSLGCEEPYQECCPDSNLCYNLTIFNEGNGNDKFSVEITNLDYLSRESFTVNIGSPTIEIQEKRGDQVPIMVKTPSSEGSIGVYDIDISVKSEEEEMDIGYTIPQTYTFTTRIKGDDSSSGPSEPGGDNGEVPDDDDENDGIEDGLTMDFQLIFIIALVLIIIIGFAIWRMGVSTEEN
jgi:hypothetical protein